MELIKPNGDIAENKKVDQAETSADGQGPTPGTPPPEDMAKEAAQTKPGPAFACEIKDGFMTIKISLAAAAASEDLFCTMRGFMDSKRDQAMAIALEVRQAQAANKVQLAKTMHDVKHRSFLNRLIRRK